MNIATKIVMGLGILFAVVGIILFIARGSEGKNTLKFLGMEFQLSGSSLVFFVIGVVMVVLPFAKQEWFGGSTINQNIPQNPQADSNRKKAEHLVIKGDALQVKGRFEDADSAEFYYTQAIELSSDYDYAIAQRSQVRLQKEVFVAATEDILKAIVMKPDNGAYHDILARICLVRGDTTRACDEWSIANRNGFTKQKSLVGMICPESAEQQADGNRAEPAVNTESGMYDGSDDIQSQIDNNQSPWILRCEFFDGGQAYINNNNEIYMNYLGQLIPIGKKLASLDRRFTWIYSIETGTYLDLYNNLMGTNQYGVDANGFIWGQTVNGVAKVGSVSGL